jgi:hypothetical protein
VVIKSYLECKSPPPFTARAFNTTHALHLAQGGAHRKGAVDTQLKVLQGEQCLFTGVTSLSPFAQGSSALGTGSAMSPVSLAFLTRRLCPTHFGQFIVLIIHD